MKYQLIVNNSVIQYSNLITDLQRIAANLDISRYTIISNYETVYQIKG